MCWTHLSRCRSLECKNPWRSLCNMKSQNRIGVPGLAINGTCFVGTGHISPLPRLKMILFLGPFLVGCIHRDISYKPCMASWKVWRLKISSVVS